MAVLTDSYSESNQNRNSSLSGDETGNTHCGQSFTGDGGILNSVKFYLKKLNSPTGNINAYIYAETHDTAFGTDSLGTGDILATSDNFDVTSLGTSYSLSTFTFSGSNKITLTNTTKYVVVVKYDATISSVGSLFVGYDDSSASHNGNYVRIYNNNWYSDSAADCCFYVYVDDATTTSSSTSTSITTSSSTSTSSTSTSTTSTSSSTSSSTSTSTTSSSTSTSTTSTSSSTSTTITITSTSTTTTLMGPRIYVSGEDSAILMM